MNTDLVAKLFKSFESIAHREGDVEYWLARELQDLLGYTEWRKFLHAIDRSKVACKRPGQDPPNHFVGAAKLVDLGSEAQRRLKDFAFTRYACNLAPQTAAPLRRDFSLLNLHRFLPQRARRYPCYATAERGRGD